MPDQALQNFYNDRRKRGLSDRIIYNELEASGWSKDGLQELVDQARAGYESQPNPDFFSDGTVLEYAIPKQPKPKHYGRIATAIGTVILYGVFGWQETHDWIIIIPILFVFGAIAFLSLFTFFVKWSDGPRRIRLDGEGVTIVDPPGRTHRWTEFVGYQTGQRQIPAEEQADQEMTGPIFTLWKQKIPTRPVIKLYATTKWLGMKSTAPSLTLPLPPGKEASIQAFVQAHVQAIPGKPPSATFAFSWKVFVFGIAAIFFLLIVAIIIVLS